MYFREMEDEHKDMFYNIPTVVGCMYCNTKQVFVIPIGQIIVTQCQKCKQKGVIFGNKLLKVDQTIMDSEIPLKIRKHLADVLMKRAIPRFRKEIENMLGLQPGAEKMKPSVSSQVVHKQPKKKTKKIKIEGKHPPTKISETIVYPVTRKGLNDIVDIYIDVGLEIKELREAREKVSKKLIDKFKQYENLYNKYSEELK